MAKEKVVKLRDAAVITKTEKGKIKLHQTKDDSTSKGLLKGGGIGVIFAVLFGPAGWIVAGAAAGGALATFDRGIKNKLLKELGENMTPEESAMAVLVENADWETAFGRMADHDLRGRSSCRNWSPSIWPPSRSWWMCRRRRKRCRKRWWWLRLLPRPLLLKPLLPKRRWLKKQSQANNRLFLDFG